MIAEPALEADEAPMDYLIGSLTAMPPVSEKQVAKNLKRRNPVGFSK